VVTALLVYQYNGKRGVVAVPVEQETVTEVLLNTEFGLNLDSFEVVKSRVGNGEFLANILLPYNVSYQDIHTLAEKSKSVFDVRKLAAGNPYTLFLSKDSAQHLAYFVYQPNAVEYVVYALQDSVHIWTGKKEIVTEVHSVAGRIETSLYDALSTTGENPILSMKMAEILAWSVDFYRIQKNDWFKVIFEKQLVDGETIGYGKIRAIDFNHEGRDYLGFYFEQDSVGDYFDEQANSLRKAFLKSPLKYSRLTSGFTRRRFHPVQKRWKAHLGTDYAAPRGTPILATGDGKVIEARFKRFNGNYVKIKHNGTYSTQYLHMKAIKKGVRPGKFVRQGEVIGYVGSTGLATGPHVCYRFWKNGKQVNHLKEEFPPSEPVKPAHKERFLEVVANYTDALKSIPLPVAEQLAQVGS
jgi:murein DD-endopeptidase MepM/ murein hydrolase activator NlpD